MSIELITIFLFASMLLFLFLGVPIAFGIGATAFAWAFMLMGPKYFYISSLTFFSTSSTDIMITIPMFILMGNLLMRSEIANDVYEVAHIWMGGLRGGLAMGTILVCALLAACTGLIVASMVPMALIALPSMLKRGYKPTLAVGSVGAGGALGTLIPPSIPFILYATLANESIGKLFMSGVGPGILMAVLYICYIGFRCAKNPTLAPAISPDERVSFHIKLIALKPLLFPVCLIIFVLGSIWLGMATPTEGGSIGAFGALIACLLKKRLNKETLKVSLESTLNLTVMAFWILIAATCFNNIYITLGAQDFVHNIVNQFSVNKYLILIMMQLSIFLLGFIMDEFAIILLATPLFIPIIVDLGFNKIWFGALFILNIQMAYLTPPYGFGLFWLRSTLPEGLTMRDVYVSIIPFVFLLMIGLIMVMIFPQIALWLPNYLIK